MFDLVQVLTYAGFVAIAVPIIIVVVTKWALS